MKNVLAAVVLALLVAACSSSQTRDVEISDSENVNLTGEATCKTIVIE